MNKLYPLLLALTALSSCGSADKPSASINPVFDVPTLLGKNIDQVKATLGKPEGKDDEPTALQLKSGVTEWEKSYKRDTTLLLVTYDAKTRQVADFFISTNHGTTTDYAPLLRLANVQDGDIRMIITPVPTVVNPQLYTGVKISAK